VIPVLSFRRAQRDLTRIALAASLNLAYLTYLESNSRGALSTKPFRLAKPVAGNRIESGTFYDAAFFLFYAVSTLVLWRDGARGVTDWKGN
jgi:hypothetical protein